MQNIEKSISNLNIKAALEYLIGILTAPFLAYGVSQTLAEHFTEAAGWTKIDNFTFSPIFLALATLMIVFAFHCFATSFAISKKFRAYTQIREKKLSNDNVDDVTIYGIENDFKKEAKRWLMIGIAIFLIILILNASYFLKVMGGQDITGIMLSFMAALIPGAILIFEAEKLSNTKFEIIEKKDLILKGKDNV